MRFRGNVIEVKRRNRETELEITPETAVPHFDGMRIDYDLAVLALIQRE